MTTLAEWVEETRYHLDGDRSEQGNTLAAAYTAGAGTITLTYDLGNIAPGAILSIGTNVMRVLATNEGAKTATVIAGWNGSTDANASINALVRVNPRFTDHRIVKALNQHLSSLSAPSTGLFKVGTTNLSPTGNAEGYDLSGVTGLQRILDVRREVPGSSQAWPRLRAGEWELLRSAPTADFASGVSLRIRAESGWVPGFTVQVVHASSFTTLAALTDNVSTTGIPATAEDIPPIGAAIRLMSGREVARNATEARGSSRRASEVPPGAVGRSYGGLVGLWSQRVAEEAERLRAQYPEGR